MHKFALLFLVAALSFGLMGCAVPPANPRANLRTNSGWDLPDPDQATIVDVWSEEAGDAQHADSYVVVLSHTVKGQERFDKVFVDKETFASVHEGDTVEIELMSVTSNEDNRYILEIEYCWHVGDQDLQVIFKCDATERPIRPDPGSDKY